MRTSFERGWGRLCGTHLYRSRHTGGLCGSTSSVWRDVPFAEKTEVGAYPGLAAWLRKGRVSLTFVSGHLPIAAKG